MMFVLRLFVKVSLLKDQYFQPELIKRLAEKLEKACPSFSAAGFVNQVLSPPWETLELMDRLHHVTHCLKLYLPDFFPDALGILAPIAGDFEGFDSLVFPDFVQQFGLNFPDESIAALESFTELCTSEFAVRPFIQRYPKRMFRQLIIWANSNNYHHRRLASEGCRPRLPWASALSELKRDPSPIFPVLELLKTDPELYVRRSVANNLNDISKDHPERVIGLVKRWQGKSKDTDWIIKHACRTLLKQGRPQVLQLFGFSAPEAITASPLVFNRKRIRIGGTLVFSSKIQARGKSLGKLRLEYVVHFVKKSGNTSTKVFQLSEKVEQATSLKVEKRHRFADLSTRKHYPGIHRLEIRVNGVTKSEGVIELTT